MATPSCPEPTSIPESSAFTARPTHEDGREATGEAETISGVGKRAVYTPDACLRRI
ncbi:hypothetical protein [Halalkalicoccus sp. NIPERK01]|uniref:hypothetical protein n=1 Tax=Halalkalicoccus sp. NIPERK01 TaxID=3053469 RepID=UPI00256EE7D9|nr:hypothetical protein [Halalkalicoccus sp. NIPERK01]MDL5362219.1 hypothetical protein [Halalkalicoccus sp. NIPERK01]